MLYEVKDISNPWSDLELLRLEYYGDSRRLNVGEELCGILVDVGLGLSRYGGLLWTCTIESLEDGIEQLLWIAHADLRRQFQEERPRVGDYVSIRRFKNDGRLRRYKVTVNAPPPAVALPVNLGW